MAGTLQPRGLARAMDYDAIRGVLILLVICDHNDVIRQVRGVDAWFLPMTFHVAGFLLLPFLLPPKRLSWPMARDHAVRYLVPFVCAVLVYAVAYQAIVLRHLPDPGLAGAVATALLFADPASLHAATGFIVLWFLPALLTLVLLSALHDRAAAGWRAAIVVVALAVHLEIGDAPQAFKDSVPQGLLVALYVFPLGLILRPLLAWRGGLVHPRAVVPCCAIVLMLCWWFEHGREIEVATLILPSLGSPLWILATDLSDVTFLVGLVALSAPLGRRIPAVQALGRNSLLVYLIHPLLYKIFLGAMLRYFTVRMAFDPRTALLYWIGAAFSVAAVAAASLAAARAVTAWAPLRALVMPRGLADWLPVAAPRQVRSRQA